MNPARRARARALRAARAVTLGSALVACSSSHTVELDAATDASPDAPVADAGRDAPLVCPPIFPPTTEECCEAEGGFWEDGRCIVAVPGPFVPPRMV
ncbi:MAG: hypothetical protein KF901_27095 [Myxococcales bacterium]|nr:hypothetical protein [Myxococcales bacterium]